MENHKHPIAEAHENSWFGEVEALGARLEGVRVKLARMERLERQRVGEATDLPMSVVKVRHR